MVVFGGIYEVTKELNDMIIYNIKTKKWVTLFEEQSSPIKTKNTFISPDISPESKGFAQKSGMNVSGTEPRRPGTQHNFHISPSKT